MAHPGLEFIQFGDFWDDRRSFYRNHFFDLVPNGFANVKDVNRSLF